MTIKEQLYQFTGSSQHVEFERELQAMVFDRERREKFYRNIIDTDWGRQLEHDTFRSYFEEYAAERKSNQQDYTPGSVAFLLARFTENSAESMRNSDYTGGGYHSRNRGFDYTKMVERLYSYRYLRLSPTRLRIHRTRVRRQCDSVLVT